MTELSLQQRYEQFKEVGYTVFEQVYDEAAVAALKRTHQELQNGTFGEEAGKWWFGNTCELAPKIMLPAISNPLILDFAEMVMGPFVQLDNLTLAGFPSRSKEEAAKGIHSWHRDRWANFPEGSDYRAPLSVNAISYLQELTDEYGPLRVIDGSHRKHVEIDTSRGVGEAHPDERVLHMKAGDVVLTHNGLVHSGTPNTSGDTRYFFSVYYNRTWLKHTDNHSGPNVQYIVKDARKRNDHRMLRLFGIDDHLEARANSGFLQPDQSRWAEWSAADKAAIIRD